jgi:hypothetical protein
MGTGARGADLMREVRTVCAREGEGHDQGVRTQGVPALECLQGVGDGLDVIPGHTEGLDEIRVVIGHEEHDPQGAGGRVIRHDATLSEVHTATGRRGCRKRGS